MQLLDDITAMLTDPCHSEYLAAPVFICWFAIGDSF